MQCPCHVCGLFNSTENQYAVLLPFLREGWARGEKTLILLDHSERDHRLRRLKDYGIDVEAAQQSGQLQIEVGSTRIYVAAGLTPFKCLSL